MVGITDERTQRCAGYFDVGLCSIFRSAGYGPEAAFGAERPPMAERGPSVHGHSWP